MLFVSVEIVLCTGIACVVHVCRVCVSVCCRVYVGVCCRVCVERVLVYIVEFVCPSMGFYEFLTDRSLEIILSSQHSSGCFKVRLLAPPTYSLSALRSADNHYNLGLVYLVVYMYS